MKYLNLFMISMIISVASFAQASITGSSSTCVGVATPYADATTGGMWSVSNVSLATISASGVLVGVMPGVDTVIYTLPSSSFVIHAVTINALPCPITGVATTCLGGTTTLADCLAGGVWFSSIPAIASISAAGVVSGVASGSAIVTYADAAGCYVTLSVAVSPLPTPYLMTGGGAYCAGGAGADVGLSGSATGIVYQLFNGGVMVGSPVPGSGASISFGLQTAPGVYTVVATNASTGCSANMSLSAIVSIVSLPSTYMVLGGGSYCAGGGSGSDITLSSSDFGVNYTLDSDGVAERTIAGTGGLLDFGYHLVGSYTVTATSGGTSCTLAMTGSAVVAVGPLPTAYIVTGGGSYCAGGAGVDIGLSSSNTGINYQLYDGGTPVGSPIAGTGSVLNFGMQTVIGTYSVVAINPVTGCTNNMTGSVIVSVVAMPAVFSVSGGGSYCAGGGPGGDVMLSASSAGVTYTLDSDGVADMTLPGTGSALNFGYHLAGTYTVTAMSGGTSCTVSMAGSAVVALGSVPAIHTVTGGGAYCSGGAGEDVGLDGSSTGVNYQLYDGTTAVGLPIPGTGSALSFGLQTAAGSYTVVATNTASMCTSTMSGSVVVTIVSFVTPSVSITASPGTTVCAGTLATFTATPSGGGTTPAYSWTVNGVPVSGAAGVYSYIPADGDVVGVSMTSSAACATPSTVSGSTVVTVPAAVTASGSGVSCDGSYILTATGATSYSWAPGTGLSCTGCASPTCNPTATTTYTVTGTSSGCSSTATVMVDGNRIMGSISPTVSGTIEVWLIQFNPADSSISALDSQVACTSGGSQYYNFADPASGNYMVKAYLAGGTPGASGYIPTYGASSAHWYSATGITHSSATDNMDIAMIYGTVPSGPGFIGGYIASGAGRGTSVPGPSVGMLIYLTDASGNVLTYTTTDGSGNYSFNGLANNTYIIYPEDYQYNTTASSTITLSGSSENVTNIDFKQYTNSMIIVPFDYSTGVTPVTAQGGINVFPNPASGSLNITWENQSTGTGNLVITDVLGREVLKSAVNINAASGTTQVSLQGIKDGVYLLTIKGENVNYSAKVLIQQ